MDNGRPPMPTTETARLELHGPAAQRALTAGAVLVRMEPQPLEDGAAWSEGAPGDWRSWGDGECRLHPAPYAPGTRLLLVLHLPDGPCPWQGCDWPLASCNAGAMPGRACSLNLNHEGGLRERAVTVGEARPVEVPGGLTIPDLRLLGYSVAPLDVPLSAAELRTEWYATHPGQAHAWLVHFAPQLSTGERNN